MLFCLFVCFSGIWVLHLFWAVLFCYKSILWIWSQHMFECWSVLITIFSQLNDFFLDLYILKLLKYTYRHKIPILNCHAKYLTSSDFNTAVLKGSFWIFLCCRRRQRLIESFVVCASGVIMQKSQKNTGSILLSAMSVVVEF